MMDQTEIERRFRDVFGPGWRSHLAEAIDVRGPTITEQIRGDRVPGYMLAILELIEALPPKHWPARWAKLAARAKAAKAKAAQSEDAR